MENAIHPEQEMQIEQTTHPEQEVHPEETHPDLASLRQLLAESQQEAASLRQALAEKQQAEHRQTYRTALHRLLEQSGANPAALELITLQGDALDEAGKTPEEAAAILREKWQGLFTERKALPMGKIAPPKAGLTITRQDVANMSVEDINRRWPLVRQALAEGY